jgi:hypothetical protein
METRERISFKSVNIYREKQANTMKNLSRFEGIDRIKKLGWSSIFVFCDNKDTRIERDNFKEE